MRSSLSGVFYFLNSLYMDSCEKLFVLTLYNTQQDIFIICIILSVANRGSNDIYNISVHNDDKHSWNEPQVNTNVKFQQSTMETQTQRCLWFSAM